MNLQSQSVTTALALYPLHFLQWVTPVLPAGTAHGGLPQSAFTPQGVEVVIEPFTGLRNWTMAAYDVAGIYVNGVFTGVTKTIFPGEESDRFLLHIPASWFVNGINNVFYRVKRLSGNSEDSIALDVLYHAPVAGITISHPASVGPGQPGSVTINISYARPYDTVTLTIGTWSITFTNFDHTKPITYPLTAADLQQIGVGNHPVSAVIRDQLSNSTVSPTTSIAVIAAPPLSVNPSQLSLNGVMVRSLHLRAPNVADAPGNTAVLQVTGGVGPYTFQSSAPQIASVNAQGKVEGMGNGSAVITIRDQNGATVSVQVTVSDIYDLTIFHFVGMTYPLYLQTLAAKNWISMTPQIQAALLCYNAPALNWIVQPDPRANSTWTGPASGNSAQAYNGINGSFAYHPQTGEFPNSGLGFYLKP